MLSGLRQTPAHASAVACSCCTGAQLDSAVHTRARVGTYLIPSAAEAEAKVFYLKMLGDYWRYLAEVASSDHRKVSFLLTHPFSPPCVTCPPLSSGHTAWVYYTMCNASGLPCARGGVKMIGSEHNQSDRQAWRRNHMAPA